MPYVVYGYVLLHRKKVSTQALFCYLLFKSLTNKNVLNMSIYLRLFLVRVSRDQLIIDWGDAIPDANEAPLPSPSSAQNIAESTDLVNIENTMGMQ